MIELLVDGTHVNRIGKFLLGKVPASGIIIVFNLLGEFKVDQVLHLALSVHEMRGHNLVFLGAEVGASWLLDVFFVNLFAKAIHLHLLVQNLTDGVLLLSAFDVACHLELVILTFECFQLLFILSFLLLGPHEVHFEAFTGILDHTVSILKVVQCRAVQHCLVLLRKEWCLLDEFVVKSLLLLRFELDFVRFYLVSQDIGASLQIEHVVV